MSVRCWLGFHLLTNLTPDRGICVHEGSDDEYDESQFLHISVCDRCGKVLAYVGDNLCDDQPAGFHREAEFVEVLGALTSLDPGFYLQHRYTINKQFKVPE